MIQSLIAQSRALIFDCDGTLVDTPPVYARAWGAGFRESGLDMTADWYMARAGASENRLIEQFAKEHNTSLDSNVIVPAMRRAFLRELQTLAELTAVTNIAREYRGKLPLAVASGGSREIVTATLASAGLTHLFDVIVTFDDVGRAKPEPDLFLKAADGLGVSPKDCLVFEDSAEGLEAAHRAGMMAIDVADLIAGK